MAQMVLGVAGAVVGGYFGGPLGAQVGWALGSAIGGSMAPAKKVQGPQQPLMDLKIIGTNYGQPIPYLRGVSAVAGQVWWNTDRRPTTNSTTTSTGGKGGGGETVTTTSTTTYDMDLLIGLTDNVIDGVARVWANGKLVWTESVDADVGAWERLTVYTGDPAQLPDPTYEAAVGSGNAPAYRGRGSVFIQGLQLGTSGQVPNFVFEVVADGTIGYVAIAPFDTLDASTKGSDVTLAGDSLTASRSTFGLPGINSISADSEPRVTGKWFYEVTLNDAGNNIYCGFKNSLYDTTPAGAWVGRFSASGLGVDCLTSTFWQNNSNIGSFSGLASSTPGTVFGFAIDFDARTLKAYRNGVLKGTITFSASPGVLYVPAFSLGQLTPSITLNFGASAWVYGPPAGYSGWGVLRPDTVTPDSTLQEVVSDLCVRAGLTTGQIDVSALSNTTIVRGMPVSQIVPTRQTLELLMTAYAFELTVSDKIYFKPRGAASVLTIPYDDLGASKGSDQPEPFALRQLNDLEVPAQVAISYINFSDAYQDDTQYSDRLISATSGSVDAKQLALVLTPSEAKALADVIILDQASSLATAPVNLLGTYSALEPTDPVTVTDANGNLIRMRLIKRTDSFPLLSFEAVVDNVSVLTSTGTTSDDYDPVESVPGNVDTLMELMDIPILQDADNDAGFYVATRGDGTPYPGAIVFKSTDGGVSYTRAAEVLESATLGECTTTLGNWIGPRVIDEVNTVTVDVGADGTLATTTRSALLSSSAVNAMLIGDEVVQFLRATLVSPGVYTLSGLLRGGRGTEWAMVGHAASERCVVLSPAGLRRIVPSNSELGVSLKYKGVTVDRAISTAAAVDFTDSAIGLKPFSPTDARGERDSSNNLTITWQRRSRLATRIIGTLGINIPLGEATESYEVDVYTGSPLAVVRTISSATPSASYSAAEQTADGNVPGAPVYLLIYQLSATVGRGYPLEATV